MPDYTKDSSKISPAQTFHQRHVMRPASQMQTLYILDQQDKASDKIRCKVQKKDNGVFVVSQQL